MILLNLNFKTYYVKKQVKVISHLENKFLATKFCCPKTPEMRRYVAKPINAGRDINLPILKQKEG